jgi:hypothetical protein
MATPGTYTVTSQSPDTYDFTTPGNPVLGVQVYFTTGEGNRGSVFVPQARYTINNIKTLVAAAARDMDAVGAITGTY